MRLGFAFPQVDLAVGSARKIGAAELVMDAQFSPGVETPNDLLFRMEDLWRTAKPARFCEPAVGRAGKG